MLTFDISQNITGSDVGSTSFGVDDIYAESPVDLGVDDIYGEYPVDLGDDSIMYSLPPLESISSSYPPVDLGNYGVEDEYEAPPNLENHGHGAPPDPQIYDIYDEYEAPPTIPVTNKVPPRRPATEGRNTENSTDVEEYDDYNYVIAPTTTLSQSRADGEKNDVEATSSEQG